MFSGAGDSGVWPGSQQVHGAMSYITPMTMVFILIWYVTGALTNSTSKQTLQARSIACSPRRAAARRAREASAAGLPPRRPLCAWGDGPYMHVSLRARLRDARASAKHAPP